MPAASTSSPYAAAARGETTAADPRSPRSATMRPAAAVLYVVSSAQGRVRRKRSAWASAWTWE